MMKEGREDEPNIFTACRQPTSVTRILSYEGAYILKFMLLKGIESSAEVLFSDVRMPQQIKKKMLRPTRKRNPAVTGHVEA
jgi:hypothetical protein